MVSPWMARISGTRSSRPTRRWFASGQDEDWDAGTIESLGMMPNYYLGFYYYTKKKLAEQEKWPPSRGETVIGIENDLLRQYADPDLKDPPRS